MKSEAEKTVLFLCTGNYYRSRLAELLFNHYAETLELPWHALSMGLAQQMHWKGISPCALQYLEQRQLIFPPEKVLRDPIPVTLEDVEQAEAIVLLNRSEHQIMMSQRFGLVAKVFEERGRLRYWNVYDIPRTSGWLERFFQVFGSAGFQREESGTEHVDFAVQSLVRELSEESNELMVADTQNATGNT